MREGCMTGRRGGWAALIGELVENRDIRGLQPSRLMRRWRADRDRSTHRMARFSTVSISARETDEPRWSKRTAPVRLSQLARRARRAARSSCAIARALFIDVVRPNLYADDA